MKREILDELFNNNYTLIRKQFVGKKGKEIIAANGQTKEDILHNYQLTLLENCGDIKIDESINRLLNADITPDRETIGIFCSKVLYNLNRQFQDANKLTVLQQKIKHSVDLDNVSEEEEVDLRQLLEDNLHILSDEEHMYVTYFNRYKKGEAAKKIGIDRKTFRKRIGLIIGKIKAQIKLSEQLDLM